MAVVLPEILKVQPRGLTPELIDRFAGRRARENQLRFDTATTAMNEQLAAAGRLDYIDPAAREEALERQRTRYSRIADQFSGDLSRGLGAVKEAVSANVSDPFFNLNKYQVEQASLENQLKAKYGDKAIALNNVSAQRLSGAIDPVSGKITDPTVRQRLTADVREASDYVMEGDRFVDELKANVMAGQLTRNPRINYMLERANIAELSEAQMLELVNDPSVYNSFANVTTAKYDNRAQVDATYDRDGNFTGNMFTNAPSDRRFASGASQFLYGILKQKKNRRVQIQTMQDPLAVYNAKLKAANREKQEQSARATQSKVQTDKHTKFNKKVEELEGQEYNKDGSLKKPDFVTKGKLVNTEIGVLAEKVAKSKDAGHADIYSLIGLYTYMSGLVDKYYTQPKQKADYEKQLAEINHARESYPSLRGKTDKEVNELLKASFTNTLTSNITSHIPAKEPRARFAAQIRSTLTNGRVGIGDQIYELRRESEQKRLADDLGYNNFEEFMENFNPEENLASIYTTSPYDANVGGGAFQVNVSVNKGDKPKVPMYVERTDEVQTHFKHVNDVYQGVGNTDFVTNPVPTKYGKPSDWSYATVYDINTVEDAGGDVTKAGFVPHTYIHGNRPIEFTDDTGKLHLVNPNDQNAMKSILKDITASAKAKAKYSNKSMRDLVLMLTNNTLDYQSMKGLERDAMYNGYLNIGTHFVDLSPTFKNPEQLDKLEYGAPKRANLTEEE